MNPNTIDGLARVDLAHVQPTRLPQQLQLRRRGLEDTPAARIVDDHLGLLQVRKYEELARALVIEPGELRSHLDLLRTLDPRPGERFSPSSSRAVIPDVLVVKMSDGYQVLLNDDGFPRLRVSRYCRRLLRSGSGASREDREFVRKKLNAAVTAYAELIATLQKDVAAITRTGSTAARSRNE